MTGMSNTLMHQVKTLPLELEKNFWKFYIKFNEKERHLNNFGEKKLYEINGKIYSGHWLYRLPEMSEELVILVINRGFRLETYVNILLSTQVRFIGVREEQKININRKNYIRFPTRS